MYVRIRIEQCEHVYWIVAVNVKARVLRTLSGEAEMGEPHRLNGCHYAIVFLVTAAINIFTSMVAK